MKLVVGLGNPGRKYVGTRHNIGWAVLSEVARRCGTSKPKARFRGEVVEASLGGSSALLLCPHTYMNRSGASVLAACDFYKLSSEDVLVVCDDFNLPLARLRIRAAGSAGGQNGLADVIRCLGNNRVARLRIGIDAPPASWDAADFVLSKFKKAELPSVEIAIGRAADAVEVWARDGAETCMNQFNQKSSEE